MNSKITIYVLFSCLCVQAISSFDPHFLDSMMQQTEQSIEVEKVSEKPLMYRAWLFAMLPCSAAQASDVLLDFANYSSIFRHVHRLDEIKQPQSMIVPLGTWVGEGRAGFARLWGVGNIDSLFQDTISGSTRLYVTQNRHEQLYDSLRESQKGWFTFEVHDLDMAGFVQPLGKDSCRIGIIASADPRATIPRWLIRLVLGWIFPALIDDIENEVQLREK